MSKVENILRIAAILGVLIAGWAIGINQIANIVENARNVQEINATAACVEFDAPHAIIVEGVTYCYKTFQGSEIVIPLEILQEQYGDPAAVSP